VHCSTRRDGAASSRGPGDALEFPDGQVVLLARLCEGQRATVLQLPAGARAATAEEVVVESQLRESSPSI
jgi:hypothetical protein